jgi:DNA-directed RNA polymerase II subunit RPB2
LSTLFLQLFKRLSKEVEIYLKKQVKDKKYTDNKLDVASAIKKKILTNGIRYALATGNWGGRSGEVGINYLLLFRS